MLRALANLTCQFLPMHTELLAWNFFCACVCARVLHIFLKTARLHIHDAVHIMLCDQPSVPRALKLTTIFICCPIQHACYNTKHHNDKKKKKKKPQKILGKLSDSGVFAVFKSTRLDSIRFDSSKLNNKIFHKILINNKLISSRVIAGLVDRRRIDFSTSICCTFVCCFVVIFL